MELHASPSAASFPTMPILSGPKLSQQQARRVYGPTCAVCKRSLINERVFHQRYHVCPEHATADQVILDGIVQRFCQQCGRFHELERFAPTMRSCRAQLARHAERRRKRRAEASAAKARARALGVNHAVAAAGGGATAPPSLPASSAPPSGAAAVVTGATLPIEPPAKRVCVDSGSGLSEQAASAALQLELSGGGGAEGSGVMSGMNAATAAVAQRVIAEAARATAEGGCASAQSTHSTHVQQNNPSQGLDALLAAAEEEAAGSAAAAAHSDWRRVAATAAATQPSPASVSLTLGPSDFPPMPLPQHWQSPWQAVAAAAAPAQQSAFQWPSLQALQPAAPAAAPNAMAALQALLAQPAAQSLLAQVAAAPAPAPAPAPPQPPLLQHLIQQLAAPGAAAAALAALGQQLAPAATAAAPPPPAQSLAAALAGVQAAAAQLARPQQAQQDPADLMQLVMKLAQQC